MAILDYVEISLSWLFANQKGRHPKLFTKGPAFIDFPEPTIVIDSPDCGPSGSEMKQEYTQVGEDRFPELTWSTPSGEVKEYIIVIEDPDAPLPTPATHALFYSIPSQTNRVIASDIKPREGHKKESILQGGFKYGKNVRGTIYGGPRPLLNHGPHDYYYQIIALREPIDTTKMSVSPTKSELARGIVGKVIGWGAWVGNFERKWK